MVKISIISLIYQSEKLADWVYNSIMEFTPLVKTGEAEFFFVANDPTKKLISHLTQKKYRYYVNKNTKETPNSLFRKGYGKPEYISKVYQGYNYGIKKARGKVVVLINSDNFFSPCWLENLIKNLNTNTVVSSQLVERLHPKHGVFPGAYHMEFGSNTENFDKERFLSYVIKVKKNDIKIGGAYMPCAIYKSKAIGVGLYPKGNIAGKNFNEILFYGDEFFFKVLENKGIRHITALDSVVYHLKEGEDDESKLKRIPTKLSEKVLKDQGVFFEKNIVGLNNTTRALFYKYLDSEKLSEANRAEILNLKLELNILRQSKIFKLTNKVKSILDRLRLKKN